MSDSHDSLFAQPLGRIEGFSFDEQVARVFPDMVGRSVPGYSTIVAQSGSLAERYATPGSQVYDLGCSLGATTLAMRRRIHAPDCRIIAVDNSEPMIRRCREAIDTDTSTVPVEVVLGDIADVEFERASVVAMNFTLQFFAPAQRPALLKRIADGLLPGGALILSEKIAFSDPQQQVLHTEMYHSFKRANGYSDLEISQKRSALEDVLIPDTLPAHYERLKNAGFSSAEVWFQCFNFVSIIALR
ncbi:carboxy-S-adenosyl-L-methionine synthase CmoA [Granulosicoccaceae sp. 1_MG-2023]|nr:carboxy-S-adenosyl-L-methionine synthase CmoA [Granulosicoccaceae sp. 1_MG-2023]